MIGGVAATHFDMQKLIALCTENSFHCAQRKAFAYGT